MGQRGPSKNDESIEGGKARAKEKRDKKLAREKKERGKESDESEDGKSEREGVRRIESPEGRHEVMM